MVLFLSCYLDFVFSETKFSDTKTETFFKTKFFETNTFFRDKFKRLPSNKKCQKSNILLGFLASEGRRGLCGTYWVALDLDSGKTRLDSVWLSFHPSPGIQHSWWLVAGRHLNSRIQVEQRRGRRFLQKVGEHRHDGTWKPAWLPAASEHEATHACTTLSEYYQNIFWGPGYQNYGPFVERANILDRF